MYKSLFYKLRFHLHAMVFHKNNPIGPVMVSIGFPQMLKTAKPMDTIPNTTDKAAQMIVVTQYP